MGIGNDPAGGQAGLDAVFEPPPRRDVRLPWALLLDGATRDVRLDERGQYVETHPVDHKVEVAIFVKLGSLASAPNIGGTVGEVHVGETDAMQRDAETRIREALSDLISAGDIAIVSIQAYAAPRWRANVELRYQNLRLPGSEARRLLIPTTG
jgi:hypothetical protein